MTLAGVVLHLPYALAAWVFAWGLYGVVTSRHFVHLVVCLGVMQSSTYMLLTAIGYRAGAAAPIDMGTGEPMVDPLVQAMMLTDVVVEATVVALLLALVVRIHECTRKVGPDALHALRG
jgi:multicomponent Na+:H+ antiporter subunit C